MMVPLTTEILKHTCIPALWSGSHHINCWIGHALRFSLLQTIEGIDFGLVNMYVTPYRIFWIIFTSDLVIRYTDKLFVF